MTVAALDVGSNSVRLLLGEASGGRLVAERYERAVTRLGSGITATGRIGEAAIESTLGVMANYAGIIRGEGVRHVRAVGTSALREAENAADVLSLISRETGITVNVISGDEEAALIALGVVSSLELGPASLIADVGGGSTELILLEGEIQRDVITLPVGALKLLDGCIATDPPAEDQLRCLALESGRTAALAAERLGGALTGDVEFVATAGTATTLASIDIGLSEHESERVHGHRIPLNRLRSISRRLSAMTVAERAGVRGLHPDRADLIITGVQITISLMEKLGFEYVIISDHGLLEGAVLELCREVSG